MPFALWRTGVNCVRMPPPGPPTIVNPWDLPSPGPDAESIPTADLSECSDDDPSDEGWMCSPSAYFWQRGIAPCTTTRRRIRRAARNLTERGVSVAAAVAQCRVGRPLVEGSPAESASVGTTKEEGKEKNEKKIE